MDRLERNAQSMRALMDLRALILDGAFPANTRLPETQLAERLGLSRTPLRQAMDRLVEEGLLDRIETGGCRVASFTPRDIVDSIELRGVMEGTAARLAAERGAPAAVLAEMRAAVARVEADPAGNLVYRKTARNFNPMAATCGAVTVAEVEELVPLGDIDPDRVDTPGIFVQRVVVTVPEKRIEQRTVTPG